jgi:hypothetical protein
MRLANSFSEQAIIFSPEVMGVKDNVPTEVDDAILPIQPSNIRTCAMWPSARFWALC